MKKVSWPIMSTKEIEPTTDTRGDFKDMIEDSSERYDSLNSEKSLIEEQEPTSNYGEGMFSRLNEADDKKTVTVYDEDSPVATFDCDVANTIEQKIAGLQVYNNLSESAGLLFPYKRATDVVFHMGQVSFPIDIIFTDNNNKIKKICKNISPGSLATFPCSNVKNVLEIHGGLCNRLGIREGQVLKTKEDQQWGSTLLSKAKEAGADLDKNFIIKYSNLSNGNMSEWNGYPILTINPTLEKTAGLDRLTSNMVSSFAKQRDVIVYDFDGLISNANQVTIFKKAVLEEANYYGKTIDGFVVGLDGFSRTANFDDYSLDTNEVILAGDRSLSYFGLGHDSLKMFKRFAKDLLDKSKKVIVVTRGNTRDLGKLLVAKASLYSGKELPNVIIESVNKNFDHLNVISYIEEKFGKFSQLVATDSIMKYAGVPVPTEVKEKAKRAEKLLAQAEEYAQDSIENLKQNVEEYDGIKNPNAIPNTKGQYNQSVKRNTIIVKGYLTRIRDAIKILNDIKDISTTIDIIDSLASCSKIASEAVEDVFDLIDYIDSQEFTSKLGELTNVYVGAAEDVISNISRAREYINTHIIGLIILSE